MILTSGETGFSKHTGTHAWAPTRPCTSGLQPEVTVFVCQPKGFREARGLLYRDQQTSALRPAGTEEAGGQTCRLTDSSSGGTIRVTGRLGTILSANHSRG